jgi:SAM-dependent methyltransferase
VWAGLARRGARPVGIDNSEAQLATARAFQEEFDLEFPLIFGNAEKVPYPDESFDIAISEYGASIWCDPYLWIPEAARLLRPGGELVFLVNSILSILCGPDDGDIPAGDELLRESGLAVEELIEIRPPAGATTRYSHISLDWARRFPPEEVWRARKAG